MCASHSITYKPVAQCKGNTSFGKIYLADSRPRLSDLSGILSTTAEGVDIILPLQQTAPLGLLETRCIKHYTVDGAL